MASLFMTGTPACRSRSAVTLMSAGRAAYGAALLAVPGLLLGIVTGTPATRRDREVARVLGARHLLQAAVTLMASDRMVVPGAAVDSLHAASMAALAVADPRLRRAGVTDCMVASLLAVAGAVLS